jgi:hypothetical protein
MPTAPIATFGAQRLIPLKDPGDSGRINVNLKPSSTFAAGTILGEITATPGTYGAYATGNVDGTAAATLILEYACVTDASGNVTFGTGTAGQSEWGQTYKGAPVFVSGIFATQDLVGLDAGAVTKLGRLLQGTTTSGMLAVYGA